MQVIINNSIIYPTVKQMETAIEKHNTSADSHQFLQSQIKTKQDKLTFDTAPTAGSINPVTSGGVKTALDGKLGKAALINVIYPVGSVITLTNDTDPNKIYSGTKWVKMEAGRVLVSAGTYTEGSDTYTYALGSKGGEAKHQLTVEELAQHTHSATISSVGSHYHTMARGNSVSDTNALADYHDTGHYLLTGGTSSGKTSSADGYTQSVSITGTGNNAKHNNMMPYIAVQLWHRTA